MTSDEYLELREWSPLTDLLNQIPATFTKSLILRQEIEITCLDATEEFLAVGTNVGIIFWYNRAKKELKKFKCDVNSSLTSIRVVSSVEHMIAAGDRNGNVFIYQIPKEHPEELLSLGGISLGNKTVQKYTVRNFHSGPVKSIEWAKNGMKLFSGDKSGIIVLTELDFSRHETKSSVIFNEAYEIVQLRFLQPRLLLISSIFRTVICEKNDSNQWQLRQVGKKDRKLLSICGATFQNSVERQPTIICSRPGGRFWIADIEGTVQKTLVFKDIFEARRPDVPLINPSRKFMKITNEFQLLHSYMKDYCVSYNADAVFVLNLKKNRVESTVKYLRGVLGVTVNNQEIFIIEGPRSVIRIAPDPDPYAEVRSSIFNGSYNSTLSCSSSTISSQSINSPIEDESSETELTDAAECKELSPIEHLDIDKMLADAWTDPSSSSSITTTTVPVVNVEEHHKKLEHFNQINMENFDDNILYRSRRMKVIEAKSPGSTGEEYKGIVEIAQLAKADEDEQIVEEREEFVEEEEEKGPEDEERKLNDTKDDKKAEEEVLESSPKDVEPVAAGNCDKNIQPGEVLTVTEVVREDETEDGSETSQEDDSILKEILSYSSRFISDDNLHILVNGMTNSWKGVSHSVSPEQLLEAELLPEVKDIPADITESDQGYCEEVSEEESDDKVESDSLPGSDWVLVTHEDCTVEWEFITEDQLM